MDDDYSTVVSITNIGSQSAAFITTIRYEGGEYLPQLRTLAVGETAVFDLNKIRDEQIPNKDGRILPRKATVGQFHWRALRGGDNVRLIGRAEMVSRSKKVSSSYSCPVCCLDSFAELSINPGTFLLPTGGSTAVFVEGAWLDCYFNTVGPFGYPYSWNLNWWCENTSVMSITHYSGSQYIVNGLAPGSSLMEARVQEVYYDNDGMDCYPRQTEFMDQGIAQVKNGVELGNVNFSNPTPPVVPVSGIVIVTVPVTAAAANNGATSCRVCIEPTGASGSLVPNYPDGSRCSAAKSLNPGITEGFTVKMQIQSADPLPLTFKAKGMVEVTNPAVAEVKGTNPKETSNTATIQAP